jgi:O-6-methylguanine DNA methyltransferase
MKSIYNSKNGDYELDIFEIPFYQGCLHIIMKKDSLYELSYRKTCPDSKIIHRTFGEHYGVLNKIYRYINGERVSFDDISLEYPYGTPFMKKVWEITRRIPYGEVRTYKWVAQQLGYKAYRAIGMALSRNPHLIITPCHRVVRSDGSLGGFTSEGGISLKKYLLELEGVKL